MLGNGNRTAGFGQRQRTLRDTKPGNGRTGNGNVAKGGENVGLSNGARRTETESGSRGAVHDNIGYTIYGIRYTVYGIRYTLYGIRYTVYGERYTAYGRQCTPKTGDLITEHVTRDCGNAEACWVCGSEHGSGNQVAGKRGPDTRKGRQ